MDSRFTKYSVAATILVAASVVLFDPLGLFGGRHGVVLAEVAKRVNEMGTSVSTCTRTVWEQGREEPCLRANATVYASPEHGYMEEQYDADGNLTHRAYILKESRRFILVIPAEKKYMEISMSEEIFDRITAVLTPGGLISRITAGPYTELGRKRLNGLEVEGFEIRDPELLAVPKPLGFILPVNGITARVWIDVESSLPVEIDIDFTTDRALVAGFKKLRAEFRTHDIEWTAETPEGIFDPNIPADYTPLNLESTIKDNAAWIGIGFLPVVGIIAYRRRRRATLRHHHVRVTG
ncbi:MAG: hypothetical protein JW955_04030 [Sedimentisphaerales bacterium]|nr:hypothetical protein [Sedimentisphaerales bacterium]